MATLVSVQVGKPRNMNEVDGLDATGPSWTSGIVKRPVVERVWVGKMNLAGDGQADLKNHGGPDKAVLGYAASHYRLWKRELGVDLPHGAFGENLTLSGLTEDDVCLGDLYSVGEALIEVSQPRQPCWKLSRRWEIVDLEGRVRESGRTGWYYRVVREGDIGPGETVTLVERRHPEWTVTKVASVMNDKNADTVLVEALIISPYLAQSWREVLVDRLRSR